MGVFGLCAECSQFQYCGVPDPTCRVCLGAGRIDGGDIEGVDPLVVLRAALMALADGIDRDRLHAAKLLGETGSGKCSNPLGRPFEQGERMAIGREASKLLRYLGLRPVTQREVVTPAERKARKAAKAAAKERDRLMSERIDRDRAQRARERREQEVSRRAAAAIAEQHPDEMAAELEAQEVFVALEDGMPEPNRFLHYSARRS